MAGMARCACLGRQARVSATESFQGLCRQKCMTSIPVLKFDTCLTTTGKTFTMAGILQHAAASLFQGKLAAKSSLEHALQSPVVASADMETDTL